MWSLTKLDFSFYVFFCDLLLFLKNSAEIKKRQNRFTVAKPPSKTALRLFGQF
jgi:hypothetical protein